MRGKNARLQVPFNLRSQPDAPKCSVENCHDYPKRSLYDRVFCSDHAAQLELAIAQQRYDRFVESLKAEGTSTKLHFKRMPFGFMKPGLCSVVSCRENAIAGNAVLEPFKNPGRVFLCKKHNDLFWTVNSLDDGSKYVWELVRVRRTTKDGNRKNLLAAIKEIAPKYYGKPDYILNVCKELRNQKKPMPERWLQRWKVRLKIDADVEPTNWPLVYNQKRLRPFIQKFISRHRRQ